MKRYSNNDGNCNCTCGPCMDGFHAACTARSYDPCGQHSKDDDD